jgi:hypothetical protein
MIKNMMKTISFAFILVALTSFSATANAFLPGSSEDKLSQGIEAFSAMLSDSKPSIKRGQAYDGERSGH